MRRREFITLIGGAAAWPVATSAQQATKIFRIGFLGATAASSWVSRVEAFRLGLRDLGYAEGKNIVIEFRWAEGEYDQLPALAADLVRQKVDVLVTFGTPGTLAAKRATTAIPIVILYIGDAVAAGVVASIRQPGENITGSTYFLPQLLAKRLELLKEAMPHITEVAILVKPDNPLYASMVRGLETTANALNVRLQRFDAYQPSEFGDAFLAMSKKRVDAVMIAEDAVFLSNVKSIADLAAIQSLPLAGFNEVAEAGGLLGYGIDFHAMCRRGAMFVDKVLRGVMPADIPVEQATKFETVLNMRTAKTLGVMLPTSILLRADRVIE